MKSTAFRRAFKSFIVTVFSCIGGSAWAWRRLRIASPWSDPLTGIWYLPETLSYPIYQAPTHTLSKFVVHLAIAQKSNHGRLHVIRIFEKIPSVIRGVFIVMNVLTIASSLSWITIKLRILYQLYADQITHLSLKPWNKSNSKPLVKILKKAISVTKII
jgi:hypothetical protein